MKLFIFQFRSLTKYGTSLHTRPAFSGARRTSSRHTILSFLFFFFLSASLRVLSFQQPASPEKAFIDLAPCVLSNIHRTVACLLCDKRFPFITTSDAKIIQCYYPNTVRYIILHEIRTILLLLRVKHQLGAHFVVKLLGCQEAQGDSRLFQSRALLVRLLRALRNVCALSA